MDELRTYPEGTPARCNRCDAQGALPKLCIGHRENERCWRLDTMCTLDCGHMDAHWIHDEDLDVRRYYMLSRPPSIGTHPKGTIASAVWMPRQEIPGTQRVALGWIEYAQPLPMYDIWHYSLFCADVKERAMYVFWNKCREAGKLDENEQMPEDYWIFQSYMEHPIGELLDAYRRRRAGGSLTVWAALILRNALPETE